MGRCKAVACAGNGVGCVAGEAGAGAVVGGDAVVAESYFKNVCS